MDGQGPLLLRLRVGADRGVLFGIKGLVVESSLEGWNAVEDFLLSGVGVRGVDLRVVLPSSSSDE